MHVSRREKIGGVGKNPNIDAIGSAKAESGMAAPGYQIARKVTEPAPGNYNRLKETVEKQEARFEGRQRMTFLKTEMKMETQIEHDRKKEKWTGKNKFWNMPDR